MYVARNDCICNPVAIVRFVDESGSKRYKTIQSSLSQGLKNVDVDEHSKVQYTILR